VNAYGLPVDLSKNYLKVNLDDLDEEPGTVASVNPDDFATFK